MGWLGVLLKRGARNCRTRRTLREILVDRYFYWRLRLGLLSHKVVAAALILLLVAAATLQTFLSLFNCKLLLKLWSERLWLSITFNDIVQICVRFSFESNLWFAIGPTVPHYFVLSFLSRNSLQTSIRWWDRGPWREFVSLVELLLTRVDESQPALVKVIPPLHIHHHAGLLQLIAN